MMMKKLKFLLEKNKYIKKTVLFIYSNSYGKLIANRKNKLFLKNGKDVLMQIDKVYKELNKDYWLDFGTLLGAYRNKNFLKHDDDIDIGMFLHDYQDNNEKIFVKYGFKKIRSFTIDDGEYGREETYEYKGVGVDIFYYSKVDTSKAYYHDFRPIQGLSRDLTIEKRGGLIPRELTLALSSIGHIHFLKKVFPIPEPIEEHLRDRYGDDFMIEKKLWDTDQNINKNISILNNKIGVRKIYD